MTLSHKYWSSPQNTGFIIAYFFDLPWHVIALVFQSLCTELVTQGFCSLQAQIYIFFKQKVPPEAQKTIYKCFHRLSRTPPPQWCAP